MTVQDQPRNGASPARIDRFDRPVHLLVEEMALAFPDRTAFIHDGHSYSYAWLNGQANTLARVLLAGAAGPEVRIAVYLEREPRLLIAMLAVLKTGGAYVPIDPKYPAERVAVILEDAQAAAILTDRLRAAELPHAPAPFVLLDELPSAESGPLDVPPPPLDCLAYVLFTSGSTGRPKGVAITHRNVIDMLAWGRATYDDDQLAGVLAATSVCFDLSIFEIFLPLSCAGRLILASSALALDDLPEAGVTLVNTVPSAITELLNLGALPSTVRTVNLAGEPLRGHLVDALYALPHVDKVYNLYGPSEDTTYSTYALIPRTRLGEPRIGRPLPNSWVQILDANGKPLAAGELGELCIGGVGLARGYLGRPAMTASRFVPAIGTEPGARMYRTGDLARFDADGELEYLGRVDQQVKLRGFRIELGEIEAVLYRHQAVDEAAVLVRELEGERELVAFIGVNPRQPAPSLAELRELAARHLPAYMVPAKFAFPEPMPHTPNGKIDRRALAVLPLNPASDQAQRPDENTPPARLADWRRRLASVPLQLELPFDRPRPLPSGNWHQLERQLPAELLTQSIQTQRELLLAALAVLVGDLSGQRRFALIVLEHAGATALPLDLRVDRSPAQLLAALRAGSQSAAELGPLPLNELLALGETPAHYTVQAVFSEHAQPTAGLVLRAIGERGYALATDLGLFSQDLLALLAQRLDQVLRQLASAACTPFDRCQDLLAEERATLALWNDTHTEIPRDQTVDALIAAIAAAQPHALAAVRGAETLTYGQLAARAWALAGELRRLGLRPEEPVGIVGDRSLAAVVAPLAVLAAGATYVPIDPENPRARNEAVIADTGMRHILTSAHQSIFAELGLTCIDPAADLEPGAAGPSPATPANLAYVIFTSGSTGRPKGVAIPHQGLIRLVRHNRFLEISPADTILQVSTFAFDAVNLELWAALLNGACLRMTSGKTERLAQELAEAPVTILHLTAQLFNFMVDEHLELLCQVPTVLTGGDAISARHARRFREAGGRKLLCCYGPTEVTTLSTTYDFPEQHPYTNVPIGRPLGNTSAYLVDPSLRLVPIGAFGELLVGGEGLARGYYGRPALTAQVFVPHPFGDQEGARLYRTGDRARWQTDGTLEFGGRIDHQVKIRGFRIEVAEIENCLALVPGVREVVVAAREIAGDKRLIAWLTRDEPGPDEATLRDHLAGQLPDYMMPSAFVFMAELPTNLSGKLRRADLPLPELAANDAFVPPQTAREQALARIWAENLGRDRVGLEDNFFMLGGHSLLAIRILAAIAREMRIELPLIDFFAHATLADQAAALDRLEGSTAAPWLPPALAVVGQPLPLASAQRRVFVQYQLTPQATLYNVSLLFALEGPLDQDRLHRVCRAIARRHTILRTRYSGESEEAQQIIEASDEILFMPLDLRALPVNARENHARHQLAASAALPFDLERGPVWRLTLARLESERHWLQLDIHHIAFDYSSTRIFLDELTAGYAGDPDLETLPPLPFQYADFALAERELAPPPDQLAWWLSRLSGANPRIALPFDRPRPAQSRGQAGHWLFRLPDPVTQRLRAFCNAHQTTAFGPLLAAFAAVLGHHGQQNELCLGTPAANRGQAALQGLIGYFVNTLVLRVELSRHPSFADLAKHAQQLLVEALAHQSVPFEQIVARIGADREVGHGALFQVMFSLLHRPEPRQLGPALRLSSLRAPFTPLLFDLFLAIEDCGDTIEGAFEYDLDLFEASTIARLGQDYLDLLDAALTHPERTLAAPLTQPMTRVSQSDPTPDEPVKRQAQFARTLTQQRLATLWQDLLHLDQVRLDDNFFELGGHSLLATRMVARARSLFGVRVAVAAFFKQPSLREIARLVDEAIAAGRPEPQPLLPVPRSETGLPLSYAQERLFFLYRLQPDSPAYNMPLVLRLRGPLDRPALLQALAALVARHEILRSRFFEVEGEPRQRADADFAPAIQEERVNAEQLQARLREEGMRPFDLLRENVLRAHLFQLDPNQHVLLVNIHHIAFDGWSIDLFARDLAACYEASCAGQAPRLAPPTLHYADYAWHQRHGEAAAAEAGLSWWERQLTGAETALELPFDRLAPKSTGRGEDLPLQLPESLTRDLRRFCAAEGLSPFMPLAATFALLLARICDQPELNLGTPSANRESEQTNELMGFFVNTLVLRFRMGNRPSFRALVALTRDLVSDAVAHQDTPYDQLVARLNKGREAAASLFQAVFHMPEPFPRFHCGALEASFEKPPFPVAKFPLLLSLVDDGPTIDGELSFDASLFRASAVATLTHHYPLLLQSLLAEPDRDCFLVDFLDPAERALLLDQWNATEREYPREKSIVSLFASVAAQFPEATALSFDEDALTYRELETRALRLAGFLRELGLRPEEPVGVVAAKALDGAVAPLAVLIAGGFYVPIDPANPDERNFFILDDVGARLLLTTEAVPGLRDRQGLNVIHLVEQREALAARTPMAYPTLQDAQSLACIFFTSGSTGRPKGVTVMHRGIVRMCRNNGLINIEPHTRMLQFSSFAFDAASWDYWGAWLNGAHLRLMHGKMETLHLVLRTYPIDVLFITTQFFHFMVDDHLDDLLTVGTVLTGGEVTSAVHAQRFFAAGGRRLFNMYGPTENSTYSSGFEMVPEQEIPATLPIGRAIANSSLQLVDRSLNLVPPGVFAEICMGGDGVARGYWLRPALTAEKFVPDPFSKRPGGRLYRSGDRGRWLADGNVDFGGRLDQQVKLRGFRIEIGEIEHHLTRLPGIRDAVVEVRTIAGDKRLVAWLILTETVEAAWIRETLTHELPPYMVPAAYVFMDHFPVNENGKVLRKLLPDPEHLEGGQFREPATEMEQTLAAIWAEVVGCPRVGRDDNFFELGGHSLLATRCISRIQRELGVSVPVVALFEHSTLEAFAACVAALRPDRHSLARDAADPTLGFDLTYAQRGIWFLNQAHAGASFAIPVRHRLLGPLDALALERGLAALVARHQALRTRFDSQVPRQYEQPEARLELRYFDLRGLAAAEHHASALQRHEAKRPFDLGRAPLLRASLIALPGGLHHLLLTMHHIVSDGLSLELLVRELADRYRELVSGHESASSPSPMRFSDYVHWQSQALASPAAETDLAYWLNHLGGDLDVLYVDRPRPAQPSGVCEDLILELPAELAARVDACCRAQGLTRFMLFTAAAVATLHAHSGSEDILIGTTSANRDQAELEDMLGFFVNLLVLRTDLANCTDFHQLRARVRRTVLEAFAHKATPFELIVNRLNPERRGFNPIFQVLFNYINMELVPPAVAGLRFEPLFEPLGHTRYDLLFTVMESSHGLRLLLTWQTALFERETIETMANYLQNALACLCDEQPLPLEQLSWQPRPLALAASPVKPAAPSPTTPAAAAPLAPSQPLKRLRVPESVPIGRPFAGVTVLVLDRDQHPMPPGLHGEVYLGGPTLSRGYLRRPALTAEKFVPHLHAHTPGERLYRTGDSGYLDPHHRIVLSGRLDDQVKIRGFRVEPGEVETALARFEDVDQALVLVRESGGVHELVAFALAARTGAAFEAELRERLKAQLPPYMVPAHLRVLEQFPTTPNGKLDRRALLAMPLAEDAESATDGNDQPQTEAERLLVQIWCEVLERPSVSATANFFDLGGHSLLAVSLLTRIREKFGVQFNLQKIFETPQLRAMALALGKKDAPAKTLARPKLQHSDHDGRVLSLQQRSLWFLEYAQGRAGGSDHLGCTYNLPFQFELRGTLAVAPLARAFAQFVERHEILRSNYPQHRGLPTVNVMPATAVQLKVVDLSGLPNAAVLATQLMDLDHARVFHIGAEPLCRLTLLRLSPTEHRLLVATHHIISDGWSLSILLGEVVDSYIAELRQQPHVLPPLELQYTDFARWQADLERGGHLAADLAWWRENLAAVPPQLELPTDKLRPAMQTFNGARILAQLDLATTQRLHHLAETHGCTLFIALQTLFALLLARVSGQYSFCLGSPVAGRSERAFEKLFGFFANLLPLRCTIDPQHDLIDLLAHMRADNLASFDRQMIPLDLLITALSPPRNLATTPLFQVTFAFQNYASKQVHLPGLEVHELNLELDATKFDLMCAIAEDSEGLGLELYYNTDLYHQATAHKLLHWFKTLVHHALEQPNLAVGQLSLLDPDDLGQLLNHWNRSPEAAAPGTVLDLIAAHVNGPQKDAVVFIGDEGEETALSYTQLDRCALQLAHQLVVAGIRPGHVIGIYMQPGIEITVAILAILRAGAAFLPLDPDYPVERLRYMVDDARAHLVLTQAPLVEAAWPFAARARVVQVEPTKAKIVPPPLPCPAACAYVIYTSGSTGRPKGAMVSHRGLHNFILALNRQVGHSSASRVVQLAAFSFDASVMEWASTLAAGGTLFQASRRRLSPGPDLTDFLRARGITHLYAPASLIANLDREAVDPELVIISGGESNSAQLLERWSANPFFNAYGPTETAIATCVLAVDARVRRHASQNLRPSPLDRPLPGILMLVLDRQLRPVPAGVPGELCIGGVGVGLGYLRRPGLTAERFVPADLPGLVGERLYRSGDLVRVIDVEGLALLDFLGRIDFQLKLRGFRIELGEIEATLEQHEYVSRAVVLPIRDGADLFLAAFIVPSAGVPREGLVTRLRASLETTLPPYMLPSRFALLDELPVTPVGKLDRNALVRLAEQETLTAAKGPYRAPSGALETSLAALWAELLHLERVGADDDFFQLGGHSLMAIRLAALVRRRLGLQLALPTLFQNPTIARLAKALQASADESPTILALNEAETDKSLFLVHAVGGQVHWYLGLAKALERDYLVYGIQAACDRAHEPSNQLQAIVAHYLDELQRIQPTGPYHLGGWSVGGTIAFAMADELLRRGQEVAELILIDAVRLEASGPIDASLARLRYLADTAARLDRQGQDAAALTAELEQSADLLEVLKEEGLLQDTENLAVMERQLRIQIANLEAVLDYAPTQPLPMPVRLMRSRLTRANTQDPTFGWGTYCQPHCCDISGNHYSILGAEGLSELATAILGTSSNGD